MLRNILKESIGKHNQLFSLETIGFSYGLHLLVKSFLDGKTALLLLSTRDLKCAGEPGDRH
jgi:hypothetical protein